MTENNAAQPGLTDDEIRDIITDAHQAYGAFKTGYGLALGRAIESALLSKLRAEGVQAGDEDTPPIAPADEAISECWITASDCDGIAYDGPSFERGYCAALASAPVAGEAMHDTDSVCAWQVWWNQNKSRYTTMRQASIAAFAAGKEWRGAAPQASEPMQPIVVAADGVVRFKENRIVSKILEVSSAHGYGLNQIACGDFTEDERMQLAQLIGYSLDGYGNLSYVSDTSYDRAALSAQPSGNPGELSAQPGSQKNGGGDAK